jgi:lipopolysaccharide/colanic/teichoic acid biosynthesis glycosyltransferase
VDRGIIDGGNARPGGRASVGSGSESREVVERHKVIDLRSEGRPTLVDAATYQRVESRYERWVKPVIDRVGAALLLAIAVPAIVVCAVLIRWKMGPPVMLRQTRVGRGGKLFTLYKFRTMIPDRRSEDRVFYGTDRRVSHKTANDPRVSSIGRVLRKWSLDELPQFWNVIRGEMSLVGPRPELPEIVYQYEPWQHRRHSVRPGITGLWQISERGERPLHEATDIDLRYIAQLTFYTDLKLLVRTPLAMIGRRTGF